MKKIARIVIVALIVSMLAIIAKATDEVSLAQEDHIEEEKYILNPSREEIETSLSNNSNMIFVRNIDEAVSVKEISPLDIKSIIISAKNFSHFTPLFTCVLEEDGSLKKTKNPLMKCNSKKTHRILIKQWVPTREYTNLCEKLPTPESISKFRIKICKSLKYVRLLLNVVAYRIYKKNLDAYNGKTSIANKLFISIIKNSIEAKFPLSIMEDICLDNEFINLLWNIETNNLSRLENIMKEKKKLVDEIDFFTTLKWMHGLIGIFQYNKILYMATRYNLINLENNLIKSKDGKDILDINTTSIKSFLQLINIHSSLTCVMLCICSMVEHDEIWNSPIIVSYYVNCNKKENISISYRSINGMIYTKYVKLNTENLDIILNAKKLSEIVEIKNYYCKNDNCTCIV